MQKARIAIVGCGYWGEKLIRNFAALKSVEVRSVCDFDLATLAAVKRRYPDVALCSKFEEVVADAQIDGVVIATPVSTHFPFARKALAAGKHVLVEKPLAASSAEARELVDQARKVHRTLMVDQTFLYTAAVRQMKSLIGSGEIGDLLYFDSVRISLGLVHTDTNVLWDLGAHDLAILQYLCDRELISIAAVTAKQLGSPFENIAHLTMRFGRSLLAHCHLNWLSPVKVRRMLVGGSKKTIVYDDLEASEKIRIYHNPVSTYHNAADRWRLLSGFQNGDMIAPNLDTTEALYSMATEFAQAILDGRRPISDGRLGMNVVEWLEMAQISSAQGGLPVEIEAQRQPVHRR